MSKAVLTKYLPIAVVLVALAVLPKAGMPRSWMLYLFLFLIYLILSNMWNLLAGYAGLISLCQPAFLGLAGYTVAIGSYVGIPWWAGMILGVVVAAAFSLLISIPVFRLSGVYFAIGTLVVPEALRMVFFLWRPVGGSMQGGGSGYMIAGIADVSPQLLYWLALIVAAGSLLLMCLVLRSQLGLGLASVRDNQRAAAAAGVNVFRLKLLTFVISAGVTAMAGAIYYVYQGYIEPSASFSVKWTMILLLATVIGGIRTRTGPIIGTVIVVAMYFVLARYAGYSLLVQGLILIGIMLASPRGIVGIVTGLKERRRPTAPPAAQAAAETT
jgi:branched-chain amino acid transport system permease protein